MEKTEVSSALSQVVAKKKPGRPRKNTTNGTIQVDGVVEKPSFENHIVEMVYCNSKCLRKIISLYRSYACSTIYISFKKNNVYWYSVDHTDKVHLYIDINCSNITRYYCNEPITYNIERTNLELVFNILKKDNSNISIVIEKDNTSKLLFSILDIEYDTTEKFEVDAVIAKEYAIATKPDVSLYPIEFKISSKHFKDRVSNIHKFETEIASIQKHHNRPLQIVCKDQRVAWSGEFNDDTKINFKSKLKENETFIVSINVENLYSLSNNNLGNDFIINADHYKKLSCVTILDERSSDSPTVTVSVFIEIQNCS